MPERCDSCGKFIPTRDFDHGATRKLLSEDTHFSREEWETICKKCNNA